MNLIRQGGQETQNGTHLEDPTSAWVDVLHFNPKKYLHQFEALQKFEAGKGFKFQSDLLLWLLRVEAQT